MERQAQLLFFWNSCSLMLYPKVQRDQAEARQNPAEQGSILIKGAWALHQITVHVLTAVLILQSLSKNNVWTHVFFLPYRALNEQTR